MNNYPLKLTRNQFFEKLIKIRKQNSDIYVIRNNNKILATAKLYIENKIYNDLGHIEDVVVDNKFRNRGIGKLLIKKLINKCKKEKCYKIILECSDKDVINFYLNLGFKVKGNQMVFYL